MSRVDYVIFSLGDPRDKYAGTRQNAGFIFSDYFANCIEMQSAIVKSGDISEAVQQGKAVPEAFKKPKFIFDKDLHSLLFESEFPITEADMSSAPEETQSPEATRNVKKIVKVLVVKPLTDKLAIGSVVKKVLIRYKIQDIAKSLIVAHADVGTLAGSITIQSLIFNRW